MSAAPAPPSFLELAEERTGEGGRQVGAGLGPRAEPVGAQPQAQRAAGVALPDGPGPRGQRAGGGQPRSPVAARAARRSASRAEVIASPAAVTAPTSRTTRPAATLRLIRAPRVASRVAARR